MLAAFGLLFDPARANAWEYTTLIDPPGYAQSAYTVPAPFDALMADLGIPGTAPDGIFETRVVPLLKARRNDVGEVERVEVWREGGERREISDALFDANCIPDAGCGADRPVGPFAGAPLIVEQQYRGVDPFPEAVRPARYLYYPSDASGSGRGVLVQTQGGAVHNGTFGPVGSPFYPASALDRALHEIAAASVSREGDRSAGMSTPAIASVGIGLLAGWLALIALSVALRRRLPRPAA